MRLDHLLSKDISEPRLRVWVDVLRSVLKVHPFRHPPEALETSTLVL